MTPFIVVNPPAISEIETQEKDALERVSAWTITCQDDFNALDSFLVGLKELEKKIIADFKGAKDAAFAAHRAVCAQEAGHLDKVQEARKLGKPKLVAWQDAQEKLRKLEESRLRAEAIKRAEDEALAKAERAAEFGDEKTADAIMAAPVVVAPVVLPPVQKSATVLQTRWKFRITNPALIPREYLVADETKIGGVIRATKGSIAIPGIEAYSERV